MDIKKNWETFVFMYFLMVLIPCQGSKSEIFEANTNFDDFRLNGETLDTFLSSGDSECVLRCSIGMNAFLCSIIHRLENVVCSMTYMLHVAMASRIKNGGTTKKQEVCENLNIFFLNKYSNHGE